MSAPMGHDRTRRPAEDDDDDPVEKMLNKSGCGELHYAVQECMADNKDWRKCQKQVMEFRKCVEESMTGIKKKIDEFLYSLALKANELSDIL
ncbi:hypothetical protein ScPMuIL_014130 [Solemya velum]